MNPTIYQVQIRVFLRELVDYYKDNPDYGTKDKPYPAGSFYMLISPYAQFFGPLRDILLLQPNATYQWIIESNDGTPVSFTGDDQSGMELEMIAKSPTNEKWKKVFADAPDMDPVTKKVKVKSNKAGKEIFELTTPEKLDPSVKMKYSFLFEFTDDQGILKYGVIDPDGMTEPPPPPLKP